MNERELETWLCEHPYVLDEYLYITGRQVSLPHGRLDLMGLVQHGQWGQSIWVIELKARELKQRDVGQLLRYIADVRFEMMRVRSTWSTRFASEIEGHMGTVKPINVLTKSVRTMTRQIKGILIGRSVDDRVLTPATGGDIEVATWKERDGAIQIDWANAWDTGGLYYDLYDAPHPHWAVFLFNECVAFCKQVINPRNRFMPKQPFVGKNWE